jgi:hypothetical protein
MIEDDVARLEAIEMAAWEDMFAAAPPPLAEQLGLATERFGPTLFTVSRAIDNGQFCRVQGCGLPGDETGASIDESVKRFRALGLKNYLIQIPPGPHADQLIHKAEHHGLVLFRRSWTKFRRGTAPAPSAPTSLRIAQAAPAAGGAFGAVATAGFGMPGFLGGWLGALAGRPNWRCYLAYDHDLPVGCGAAYLDGDGAWLGIGATRPEARGHGSQSSILARRINDEMSAGAKLICTETGSAVPGEPQTSYQNILRAGFSVAYERLNFTEPS